MKKILEGSRAIAETINNIKPAVVSAFPITPQTHIVEDLAKFKADGEAAYEYVRTESEFAALSVLIGASAAGARTYTATSSQGLLLMTEVIFNAAGMRLPIVMTDANRAISAPINIWNDAQDAVTMRDAGWIMLYGEDNQETCDLHILAFKVAEQLEIPVMVNVDGFILTHVVEPVEIETSEKIKKYLPVFAPKEKLDVNHPLTFGAFATPKHYFEIRKELHDDLCSSIKTLEIEMKNFGKHFGRPLSLAEYSGEKNADTVIVAMGSVLGTIREAADELRQKGERVGILKISSLRPFPDELIIKLLSGAKNIAVVDKSISLGTEGIVATEIRRALNGQGKNISSFIVGLGGRDITKDMIKKIYKSAGSKNATAVFVGE